jgi:hypothetical protein
VARLLEVGLISTDQGETADPGEFFSETLFAGGYSQAWEALKAGQVDASVIAGDVPEELYREVLDSTRVIEEQGSHPRAVVFSKDFRPSNHLLNALLTWATSSTATHAEVVSIFIRFEPATTRALPKPDRGRATAWHSRRDARRERGPRSPAISPLLSLTPKRTLSRNRG